MIKLTHYCIVALLIAVLLAPGFAFAADKNEILNLSDRISDKKEHLDGLDSKLETYKKKIDDARKKSVTLKNQISLINDNIIKTDLEIEATEIRIDQLELEILEINIEIKNTQHKMGLQKEVIAGYLRDIQKLKSKSITEILLLHRSFSEFFSQLKRLENLQDNLSSSLQNLQKMRTNLEMKQDELKDKKVANLKLKSDLENKKAKSESQKTAKTFLIGQTFASEAKFQALLLEAKREHAELNAEISSLESNIREKLRENDLFPYGGSVVLTWPVPKNKITAYFHDPDYPYRYIFEHSGIDIRAAQGTTLRAPAPGYVLKVRDQDSWEKYNYIVLVHAGGISTVYIHLSEVYVKTDTYVERGQIIGRTGGSTRTRGAGYFTTGPHLHFEVRLNGIPVNPLNYLVDI